MSLVIEQNYTRSDAAKNLGINPNVLGRWVKEADSDDGHAFRGNGKLTPDKEEIRTLKSQVKRLQMERDILRVPCAVGEKGDGILCRRNEVDCMDAGGRVTQEQLPRNTRSSPEYYY